MADSSLRFNIFARDNASPVFGRLGRSVDNTHKGIGRLGVGFGKLAAAAGGAIAAVGVTQFFKSAVTGASDTAESLSKVGVVFGTSKRQVIDFASTAATSLGMSNQAALEATGTLGNLFVALKLPRSAAAGMSTSMVKLAGDLASFNNVKPEEALLALRSGLTGETEPLRKFGVNMNDATLRTQALRLGLIKTTKDALTPAAKAQAAYALIMDQTKTAQGDFARTSTGLANRQRILAAQWVDMKSNIGKQLLPAMVGLAGFATNTLLPALGRLGTFLKTHVGPTFTLVKEVIGDFFKGLSGAGGVGGASAFGARLRADLLPALVKVGAFVKGSLIPALRQFAGYIQGTVIPVVMKIARDALPGIRSAVAGVSKSFQDNRPQIMQFLGALRSLAHIIVTRVWPVLGPLLKLAFKGIGVSIASSLFWLARAVDHFNRVRSTVVAVTNTIRSVWVAFWGGPFGAVIRSAWNLAAAVTRVGVAAIVGAARTVRAVVGAIVGPFLQAVSGVRTAIGALVGMTAGIRGRIMGAIGNLGSLLYGAGRAVVEGLISGITSKLSALASIASRLADTIARVMPGSPVREGPLRVLNNGRAGGAIVSMLADGIKARRGAVSRALNDALGVPAATITGGPGRSAAGTPGRADSQPLVVQLILDGKTVQQVLLRVKRDNGGLSLGLA